MGVSRETEALKEQQRESKTSATIQRIKQFLTTLVSRIVMALESTATRTSQPKEESLTAVEELPSIRKTRLLSPLPQFLPPAATPGGLPLEHFLPPAATPGGV